MEKQLRIKNMVCPRCEEAVSEVLQEAGGTVKAVSLGAATIQVDPEAWDEEQVAKALAARGFSLLLAPEQQRVEHVKNLIIDLVHQREALPQVKLSVYLSEATGLSYPHLSRLFSRQAGMTIEKFLIAQKVERAKELLSYRELDQGDIAERLGYRSLSHFSQQFKRETGLSPSAYQQAQEKGRLPLDQI